jgi:hypothetical protein
LQGRLPQADLNTDAFEKAIVGQNLRASYGHDHLISIRFSSSTSASKTTLKHIRIANTSAEPAVALGAWQSGRATNQRGSSAVREALYLRHRDFSTRQVM